MIRIYKIPPENKQEIKTALEAPDRMEGEKRIINEFARNGYELRDATGLGLKEDNSYLYIKADPEFFDKNEKQIMKDNVKKLESEELEKIQKLFEDQAESAASGVGAIFGDM